MLEKLEFSYNDGENFGVAALETVFQFFKKLSIELSSDPVIPILDIYSRKSNLYVHTKT